MKVLNWLKKHKIKVTIAIIFLVIFAYFRSRSNSVTYIEYQVESKNLVETLELSGTVDAELLANLHFPAGGLVTYAPFKEGDQVNKYETIASLDQRQLKLSLEKQLNIYTKQLNTFDQTNENNEDEIYSGEINSELRRILDGAQYDLDNSVIDVELQDLSIKLSRLYSPISGILVHSPITVPNVNVSLTDSWIVVDPNTLIFVADLDETDLAKVEVGQHVTIILDAFPDKEFESTVSSISYTPKETSTGTTYEIKIILPAEAMQELRLGLNGTASIKIGEKLDTPTLPQSAISIEPEGTVVYVKNGNKYETKNIVMGVSENGDVEIISGLEKGDTVYAKEEK